MRTLVSLLHWRTLAGAFKHEAPVASFPVRIRLSFWVRARSPREAPQQKGKRRFRPDIGNATSPRKGFFLRRRRGETLAWPLDRTIQ
jgi:hypothetical protein